MQAVGASEFAGAGIETAEMGGSGCEGQGRMEQEPGTWGSGVMDACPGDGVSESALPIDGDHGEDTFVEIMVP